MILYLDASALVKRYLAEDGSPLVRSLMQEADAWCMCRVGYVETARALSLAAGPAAVRRLDADWPAVDVVEIDDPLMREAAELAPEHDLRSLDALHLAAARVWQRSDVVVATWDRRLHDAARAVSLPVAPERVS